MGSGMLNKEEIKIGDEVMLARPSVLGYGQKMVVNGLTAVEKLVYCEGGHGGWGAYHIDNLTWFKEDERVR